MIDTHTHLQFDHYDGDRQEVITRMRGSGVGKAIVIGTDFDSSKQAIALAHQYPELYAAVGLHPSDITEKSLAQVSLFEHLVQDDRVVAIGEVGLDYKYLDDARREVEISQQKDVLEAFIDLANRHALPVIFHARMGESDLLDMIPLRSLAAGGVIHCFTADQGIANRIMDSGLYISLTNMIGYPKNEALRQVVETLPRERVMIETDSPFLPPQILRGERNEPSYVVQVAETLANIWGVATADVDRITTAVATKLFKFE